MEKFAWRVDFDSGEDHQCPCPIEGPVTVL